MRLLNNSGPAIFMYSVIALGVIISATCFGIYYSGHSDLEVILWTGITFFTITYHFWLRIIMGNVSKLFNKKIHHNQWWFRERKFEKSLYKILKVKQWKGKALTYNPGDFDLKENSLDKLIHTMTKSELDHWINEVISISTMFFGLIWGKTWLFVLSGILAMIFDGQFIVIQRYNRPRVLNLLKREEKTKKKELTEV